MLNYCGVSFANLWNYFFFTKHLRKKKSARRKSLCAALPPFRRCWSQPSAHVCALNLGEKRVVRNPLPRFSVCSAVCLVRYFGAKVVRRFLLNEPPNPSFFCHRHAKSAACAPRSASFVLRYLPNRTTEGHISRLERPSVAPRLGMYRSVEC